MHIPYGSHSSATEAVERAAAAAGDEEAFRRLTEHYYYFVSFDWHEVSLDKKGGYPWISTPVQPRCPSWTSFWSPSRCASVARRARPPWSAPWQGCAPHCPPRIATLWRRPSPGLVSSGCRRLS